MADRKMSLKELSEKVGVSNVNLSKMKTGKISAIRFSTLEAICEALDCQPGAIRVSICTGEQVAGFENKESGRFEEIALIRSEKDLKDFKERYGIEGEIRKIY